MNELDKILESVMSPEATVDVEARECSPNFLLESAMLYAETLNNDIQNESQMQRVEKGLEIKICDVS